MVDGTSRKDEAAGVLARMTLILEAFDEDDQGVGLSDLSMRAGLPKSTVSRLVSGLVRQRYLEREGKLIYLGLRLFELGHLADMPRKLRHAALPVMADLRTTTGETVHLAIREGEHMVLIAVMKGGASSTSTSRIGRRVPVHATALGKAVLAHSGGAGALIVEALSAPGGLTISESERLMRDLAEIRRVGIAVELRELSRDSASVACPVFDKAGGAVAAIAVSAPTANFVPGRLEPKVRVAARTLGHRLASRASGIL